MFSPKKITPPTNPGPDGVEERRRRRQPGIGPNHALPNLLGRGEPERLGTIVPLAAPVGAASAWAGFMNPAPTSRAAPPTSTLRRLSASLVDSRKRVDGDSSAP